MTRNEKYESFLLDNKWKLRTDSPKFKILCIPLKDDYFYYAFSGLRENTAVLVPDGKKCSGEEVLDLFSSKDYNLTKYFYLKLICSKYVNAENISDKKSFQIIQNILNKLR